MADSAKPLVDMLGNEVRPGSLMYWAGTNCLCQVMGMEGKSLTIGINIPLNSERLKEFVCVVNPLDTAKAQQALKDAGPALVAN